MGTPEFAVPALKILLDAGYDIPAVITAPDKPGGRKGIQQSAVKQFALDHCLWVMQPERLKSPEFIEQLRTLKADLQVVVAFRMLPEAVWSMPPLGTMNLHGSLLPKYRGAAPINWAIMRGEKETGVTSFLLKQEIDTGDILFQEKIAIRENETAGELHDRMMRLGAEVVLRSVQALEQGKAQPMPQSDAESTTAPKIHAETCQLDFSLSTRELHNFIRGLSPYPGARMLLHDKLLKVLRAEIAPGARSHHAPGTLYAAAENRELFLAAKDGQLRVLELQLEGKRRMLAGEFINGHPLLVER